MNLKKKKKGFTLIELMAVIAIIAILAAVLVPTVSGYITRSKKTALITQVRNVVNAVEVYNSTATSGKIEETDTLGTLIPKSDTGATGTETAFVNQELLDAADVDQLNINLTYGQLKAINTDENAMNNIYKNDSDKFVYESDTITTPVQIEPADQ